MHFFLCDETYSYGDLKKKSSKNENLSSIHHFLFPLFAKETFFFFILWKLRKLYIAGITWYIMMKIMTISIRGNFFFSKNF